MGTHLFRWSPVNWQTNLPGPRYCDTDSHFRTAGAERLERTWGLRMPQAHRRVLESDPVMQPNPYKSEVKSITDFPAFILRFQRPQLEGTTILVHVPVGPPD